MKKSIVVPLALLLLSVNALAQNVGIGTLTPGHPLTVISSDDGIVSKSGTVELGTYVSSTVAYLQTYSNHPLFFATNNGSPQIALLTNGNVGIGTISPTAKLRVYGTVSIVDGTQGASKVLTSDATGNASWQTTAPSNIYFEKNSSLTSNITGADVDFSTANDITISQDGYYLICISAEGSTEAQGGDPFSCYQRDGIVKVWSRTRSFEVARVPFNYITADQNSQTVGNPPGLVQRTYPFSTTYIVHLNLNEVIGLRANVTRQCSTAYTLGNWNVYDSRLKIIRIK